MDVWGFMSFAPCCGDLQSLFLLVSKYNEILNPAVENDDPTIEQRTGII